MYHLGIPTTRAAAVISSSTKVYRDMLYNGNVKEENAAICLRIAPSFLRFGSFQISNPPDDYTGNLFSTKSKKYFKNK